MADGTPTLRWGIERRMAFLDACLFWMGQVNRTDLVRRFGVSVPQASADLARYRDLAPANMAYDASRKAYLAGAGFEPVFGPSPVDEALKVLATAASGDPFERLAWLDGVVASEVFPPIRRNVRPDVLRSILAAVREHRAVEATYQSLSRPRPTKRWIEPHALAFDGERWHVRAFCAERGDFRDFVLSRISAVGSGRAASTARSADFEWSREVSLRLAPNPALPPGARKGLEMEYGMRGGFALMRVRACFVFYVERRLGLDLGSVVRDPGRTQLVLLNREEVERVRDRARERTAAALAAHDPLEEHPR